MRKQELEIKDESLIKTIQSMREKYGATENLLNKEISNIEHKE